MMSHMRSIAILFTAAICFAAESVTTPIENDQVKVLKVTQAPHVKTSRHQHKVNRVMIYLQPGRQTFDYDGKKTVLTWKAGEVKWSPAGGMHIAEITSDNPVTIIEIELKKPGDPAKKASGALDPVKVDPKMYKVELENDQVRILRVRVGPHQVAPLHEHLLNRVVTYITDQNFRVTTPDGKVETLQHKAGEVSWGTPTKHKEENLSDKAFEVLVVELKS
jgi:quercetin dioxygenase-like cupin family protein